MRRLTAAAGIGLATAITLLGVPAVVAAETTTSLAAPEVSTSTSAPVAETSTSTEPAPPEVTTVPATTIAAPGVVSSTSRPARRPIADARAATGHTINVSTNCTYFCFAPAQMTIAAGETVTWSNRSGAEHTVKRCDPAGCSGHSGGTGTDTNFGSAIIALRAGGSFQYTFDQPGTYVYYCTLHGYSLMHGTITVTAAPVTDPTTVPPGATTPATTASTASGPHLASTGGNTDGSLVVAAIVLVLGLAAVSAGRRRTEA